MYRKKSITVIIPALNEELSIAYVINELLALKVCTECGYAVCNKSHNINKHLTNESANCPEALGSHGSNIGALVDNIVVCDNGSIDNTAAIATACGAIVIREPEKGYGAACLAAMSVPLEKDFVVFIDGDHSVDCSELPELLNPLFSGADLVIGSRTLGACEIGALSIPQILGNRLASALMRLIWRRDVSDLGPFRAVSNHVLNELQMQDRQFGWTVEMQVRAFQLDKHVVEIPVTTRKRVGQSKISGTVQGVIGASKGILGTIAKLYWRELSAKLTKPTSLSNPSSQATKAQNNSNRL